MSSYYLCCILQVIADCLSEEEIAGLKEMFKMIDTDNSGQITYEELKVGLEKAGANLKESEIYDLMQAVSINSINMNIFELDEGCILLVVTYGETDIPGCLMYPLFFCYHMAASSCDLSESLPAY